MTDEISYYQKWNGFWLMTLNQQVRHAYRNEKSTSFISGGIVNGFWVCLRHCCRAKNYLKCSKFVSDCKLNWTVRHPWFRFTIASCNDIECWSKQLHAASVVVSPIPLNFANMYAIFRDNYSRLKIKLTQLTNQMTPSRDVREAYHSQNTYWNRRMGDECKSIEMRFKVFAQMNDKSSQLPWWYYTSYQDRMSAIA